MNYNINKDTKKAGQAKIFFSFSMYAILAYNEVGAI